MKPPKKTTPPKDRGKPGSKPRQATEAVIDLVVEKTLIGMSSKEIVKFLPGKDWRYINDIRLRADFKERFAAARAERKAAFQERLTAMADAALNTHLEIMADRTSPKTRLSAAMSILDRAGSPRETKVEQSGEVTVNQATVDMTPFNGRTIEEKRHYLEHGVFPDGTKPVAQ